jgi:serine/threonine protein kinase
MLSDPRAAAPADELVATTLAAHDAPTPVDLRRAPADAAPMPDVGSVLLGRWRVVAWAGLGSASVVFRGEHVELLAPVAIKIVNRLREPDRTAVIGHLRNEALLLARLKHVNLARVWDFSAAGEHPCLVTDFIDGTTLLQRMRRDGRLDPKRALRVAVNVAEALAAAWREGIVHRDVKPENILLAGDGSAKLIDFGLAVVRGEENAEAHGTIDRRRVGTVAYLAPEQARNSAAVDHRADVYALGATLYHALTGRLPFLGNTAAQVILRHLEDQPLPPRALVPDLPDALSRLVLRMMAKRPVDRFADARELMAGLDEVREEMLLR